MKVVAVTGATGYVGRFVVPELQSHGLTVRALARPHSQRDGFDVPPEWVEGDLGDEVALAGLVHGADAVVHLAYAHVPGRYRGGEGEDFAGWFEANVDGSLRLLMEAAAAGVERFIFLSSRAVFSRTEPGRVLDETHPTSPDTHYGAYKVAVEAFMQSFARSGSMQCCTMRATGVYGVTRPVERSKWWDLICAVLQDSDIRSNGGGTEVHGADVARVIHHHLTHPAPANDIVHLSDGYITHRDVVRLAREIAGKPGPLPPAPPAPPANPLVCRRVQEMGLTLGGEAALESTVAALVKAATVAGARAGK